jgi:hypothetical protein
MYGTFLGKTLSSTTLCIAYSPSLHHHPTTRWPHRKTATPNFEHRCRQPQSCGLRKVRFQAPRSPSNATRLPGNFGHTSQLQCSSQPTICRTQAPKQQRGWSHIVSCGQAYRRIAAPGHVLASPDSALKSPASHTVTPVGDFTLPADRFLHVHINLVGPLPTSAGYTYCLTAVDRYTRWPGAIPIPDTEARALLTC